MTARKLASVSFVMMSQVVILCLGCPLSEGYFIKKGTTLFEVCNFELIFLRVYIVRIDHLLYILFVPSFSFLIIVDC